MNEELTKWVTDDIDGRFWLDDRIAEAVRGSRPSGVMDELLVKHERDIIDAEEDASELEWESAREQGYDDGYAEGFEDGYEKRRDEEGPKFGEVNK